MNGCPGLELAREAQQLLVTVVPGSARPVLDEDAFRDELARCGYADWALFDEPLAQLLSLYNQGASCERLPVGEQRDGKFSLEIADDGSFVRLILAPACGGKRVVADDVFAALGLAGVSFGVDAPAIHAACAANLTEPVLIAAAVPAVDGEDARFELLVSDARDRSPRMNELGLVDFRDLGEIPMVCADQPLMRRIPATPGKSGSTVFGKEIPARAGHNAGFSEHLVGACADPAEPDLLRALYSGQPVCSCNGVNVENVLRLRNVSMATGNVGFDGTVMIEGEVLPGMKVNATGDIIVASVVDGATLVAGGDIRIGGGAIAKASVRAGGAISVRFVEGASLSAGTTLAVEDSALQADLQANNQILVGLKNPKGRLVGGSARAMMLIQAPVLGTTAGGVTQLLLGVNPVLDAAYRDLLLLIEKRKEEEDKLDKLVKHLSREDKAGMLPRVKAAWQGAVKAWAELLPERERMEREMALMAGARVVIGAELAGAVDVSFGKKTLRLRKAMPAGVLTLKDDQLAFADAAGVPFILS